MAILRQRSRLTREHTEPGIADSDEIWRECSIVKKIFDVFFFLSATIDVEGVKTTLKVGSAKHIFLNISEIIEDTAFCMN